MRELYRLKAGTELTTSLLRKIIEYAKPELERRHSLFEYYRGNHTICGRAFTDPSKANNKVVNPFPRLITDMATGYFAGSPVTYEYEKYELIKPIIDYNDDPSVNMELAKSCSICGYAYSLCYVDRYGELRYVPTDAAKSICIYDDAIDAELLFFIRLYTQHDVITNSDIEYAEVYDKQYKRIYCRSNSSSDFRLESESLHYFNEVPVVEYVNNDEGQGDFENVLSLIDAYDVLISDSVNDSEEFSDAYLVLKGMQGTEAEDLAEARQNRVLLMPDDAEAMWLTKTMDTTYSEALKTRIAEGIHKFSGVPDMTDREFASNASGVAMRYKLLGLEEITVKKESQMRKGILRRLEIIAEYLGKTSGYAIDFRDFHIVFTRNLPANITDAAETIAKVGHLLSERTQIEMLPLDIDAEQEMKRKQEEETIAIDADNYNEII